MPYKETPEHRSPSGDEGGPFTKRMWALQNYSLKTPRAGTRRGLIMLALGLGCLAAMLLIAYVARGSSLGPFAPYGVIFTFVISAIGLFQFLRAVVQPSAPVSCPSCGAVHIIYRNVLCYVCTQCGRVLRFSHRPDRDRIEMIKVTCPQCGTEWAATRENGSTPCYACGLPIDIAHGTITAAAPDGACSNCGTPLVKASYFCPKCGQLMTEPQTPSQYSDSGALWSLSLPPTTSHGMDSISLMANSPIGFLAYATWVQHGMRVGLIEVGSKGETFSPKEVALLLGILERGIELLHETLVMAPAAAPAVRSIAPMYDQLYALILKHCIDHQCNMGTPAYDLSQSVPVSLAYGEISSSLKKLGETRRSLLSRMEQGVTARRVSEAAGSDSLLDWPVPHVTELKGPPEWSIVVGNGTELSQWAKTRLAASGDCCSDRVPAAALSLISLQSTTFTA